MSFLNFVNLDPHIHLLTLQNPREQTRQIILERIHFLSKTRRFNDLLRQAAKIKDFEFPTLEEKIKAAKQKTAADKKALNDENIDQVIAQLEIDAANDDGTNTEIDDRQKDVYTLAKIHYDEGNYERAYEIIKKLENQDLGDFLYLRTTWAKLICEIVIQNPKAKRTAERLKKKIEEVDEGEKAEKQKNLKKETIQNKAIHTSYSRKQEFLNLLCMAFFIQPYEQDFEKFTDIVTSQQYYSITQLSSQHIFRYICVCLIMNKTLHKNRQFDLYMLIEVIRRKVIKLNDPFIDFFSTLHIEFDFEGALQKIDALKEVVEKDFLLAPLSKDIIENCYFLFYKVYCKVYEKVPISKIAKSINKTDEEAEVWILNFIRSLDIEAKIDAVEGMVISSREEQSLNEKYIDLIHKVGGVINTLSHSA